MSNYQRDLPGVGILLFDGGAQSKSIEIGASPLLSLAGSINPSERERATHLLPSRNRLDEVEKG